MVLYSPNYIIIGNYCTYTIMLVLLLRDAKINDQAIRKFVLNNEVGKFSQETVTTIQMQMQLRNHHTLKLTELSKTMFIVHYKAPTAFTIDIFFGFFPSFSFLSNQWPLWKNESRFKALLINVFCSVSSHIHQLFPTCTLFHSLRKNKFRCDSVCC